MSEPEGLTVGFVFFFLCHKINMIGNRIKVLNTLLFIFYGRQNSKVTPNDSHLHIIPLPLSVGETCEYDGLALPWLCHIK